MIDLYGREIKTLRISITDRCNLRCFYCYNEKLSFLPRSEILSYEEIVSLSEIFVELGVERIKLTGGEPLRRKNLFSLIKRLSGISGLKALSLTTNGILLESLAEGLKKAGLKRINISLDTLDREKYKDVTGHNNINEVLKGIKKAMLFFSPVKINVVVLKGINDDEITDFVGLTRSTSLIVRFIEFMPVDNAIRDWRRYFISRKAILERIQKIGNVMNVKGNDIPGGGPAEYFKVDGYQGSFGIINAVSEPFCRNCDRIRIDSTGNLLLCLYDNRRFHLKDLLRCGSGEEIKVFIKKAVLNKPVSHNLDVSGMSSFQAPLMCQVGG